MKVIDPGHIYELLCLDGNESQLLRFVKRVGEKYPGNETAHSGTTLQSVLRACLDRMRYLQKQSSCWANILIIQDLRNAIWLLESRAAERHGLQYEETRNFAETAPLCKKCGHTICEHEEELTRTA